MGDLHSNQIINYITRPNPIIIEIGAYRGDDTAIMLEIPNSRIISVEPDPRNLPHLKLLKNRYSSFTVIEKAISDKDDQEVEFYLSELREDPDQANFSSSIMKPKLHLSQRPRILFNKMCKVPTISLDKLYNDMDLDIVDFIWADVQGAEHLMIKGGINALKNTKYLYTEYSNEEVFENEANLGQLQEMLPFMSVVQDYNNNVLFKNNLL